MQVDSPSSGRGRRPESFDEVAELYDVARPGYPDALVDYLIQLAALGPGSRVLEIGPGTGQLTVPLARTGARVVAVELGPELALVARRNLADFPAVRVVTTRFEDWTPPEEPFDLVVAATSFHWLDPGLRLSRCRELLHERGLLAVIETHHVAGTGGRFETASQECYQRWDDGEQRFRMPTVQEIPLGPHELDQSPLFGSVQLRRYERTLDYGSEEFVRLLQTYSNIRGMQPAARDGLLACLRSLIERDFAGRIRKHYLFELRLAGAARDA